jgi:hypothetical protein
MYCMSHNIDFATYPRTGVFWRGGLLHSVSGVSYWTLWAGIVGHLRPYANNGRFPEKSKGGLDAPSRPTYVETLGLYDLRGRMCIPQQSAWKQLPLTTLFEAKTPCDSAWLDVADPYEGYSRV